VNLIGRTFHLCAQAYGTSGGMRRTVLAEQALPQRISVIDAGRSPTPKGHRLNFAPELQRSPLTLAPAPSCASPWQVRTNTPDWLNERVCGHCGSDVLKLVNLMAGRRKVSQGESLYREHDRFEFIYAVHSGSFKSTLALADGCEQVNNFHMAGELLGLDGVADGRHASGAAALEDSEISMVSYTHLHELAAAMAGIHHTVIRLISREIVRGNCHMVMLGSLNSAQRLAAFLLNQSENLSARGYSAVDFNLKMSRGDIGSFLGLTLETISRTFSELQQQRLLKVDRRHIVISDLDGLAHV
jgi:CRP/FNR family transcriptional regulator